MKDEGIKAIDWGSIKNGGTLTSKDFDFCQLQKVDEENGIYYIKDEGTLVEIKNYQNGNVKYKYFQTNKNDWYPLTEKYWIT